MPGYRPDDDWSQTNEAGEPITGGWKLFVAFFGVLIAAVVVGDLRHIPLGAFVGIGIFVGLPAFSIWKIVVGLRSGVVSVRRGSYARAEDPFWYWTLIATFAGLATCLIGLITYMSLQGH
jgi:hypothetical protein